MVVEEGQKRKERQFAEYDQEGGGHHDGIAGEIEKGVEGGVTGGAEVGEGGGGSLFSGELSSVRSLVNTGAGETDAFLT